MPRSLVPLATLLVLVALAWGLGPRTGALAGDEAPTRQEVEKAYVAFDDGDSITIRWPEAPEVVRLLGIDTPEIQHLEHDLPFAQPFGEKAAGFLEGCVAVASRVEILRASTQDPYGRTLAYLFLDGKNYSALVVEAGLAVANTSHYGDNGLPAPAAEVEKAAARAGPVPFEKPHRYRARMKKVAAWMKKRGTYPRGPQDGER